MPRTRLSLSLSLLGVTTLLLICAVATVDAVTWSSATLEVSSSQPSAIASITVAVTTHASTPLGAVTFTIAGLTGSNTADDPALSLSGGGSDIDATGAWVQSTGSLTVQITTGLATSHSLSFTFNLVLPAGLQYGSVPTLTVASTYDPRTLGATSGYNNHLSVLYFPLATFVASSNIPTGLNTISATLQPIDTLGAGAQIVIDLSNLADPPVSTDNAALLIGGSGATIFGSNAAWLLTPHTLTLTVAVGQTLPSSTPTTITFTLRNPTPGAISIGGSPIVSATWSFNSASYLAQTSISTIGELIDSDTNVYLLDTEDGGSGQGGVVAGQTGRAKFAFETSTQLSGDGTQSIVITWPAGFTFNAGVTLLTSGRSNLPDSSTLAHNSLTRVTTITILGDVVLVGQVVFTLNGITNPYVTAIGVVTLATAPVDYTGGVSLSPYAYDALASPYVADNTLVSPVPQAITLETSTGGLIYRGQSTYLRVRVRLDASMAVGDYLTISLPTGFHLATNGAWAIKGGATNWATTTTFTVTPATNTIRVTVASGSVSEAQSDFSIYSSSALDIVSPSISDATTDTFSIVPHIALALTADSLIGIPGASLNGVLTVAHGSGIDLGGETGGASHTVVVNFNPLSTIDSSMSIKIFMPLTQLANSLYFPLDATSYSVPTTTTGGLASATGLTTIAGDVTSDATDNSITIALTTLGGSTWAAGTQVTLTLTGIAIRNPQMSASPTASLSTGYFKLRVNTEYYNYIPAIALTGNGVSPVSALAGATTKLAVQFTCAVGTKTVRITVPSVIALSASPTLTIVDSFQTGVTTVSRESTQVFLVTFASPYLLASTLYRFYIDGVTLPVAGGTSAAWSIAYADAAAAVSATDTPPATVFRGVAVVVTPSNMLSGRAVKLTVAFTPKSSILYANSAYISITLPTGFHCAFGATITHNMGAGTATCAVADSVIRYVPTVAVTTLIAMAPVSLELGSDIATNEIFNPSVPGATGDFSVVPGPTTTNYPLDSYSIVLGYTLVNDLYVKPTVSSNNLLGQTMGGLSIAFTTSAAVLLANPDYIDVSFPVGFTLDSTVAAAASTIATWSPGGVSADRLSVSGQVLRIKFAADHAANVAVTVTVALAAGAVLVRNPRAACTSLYSCGTFTIAPSLGHSFAYVPTITVLSGVAPYLFVAGQLSAASTGACTVSFIATHSLPIGARIVVVFPAGFVLSSTTPTIDGIMGTGSATFNATASSQTVRITTGVAVISAGRVAFDIHDVRNPDSPWIGLVTPGFTGTFAITPSTGSSYPTCGGVSLIGVASLLVASVTPYIGQKTSTITVNWYPSVSATSISVYIPPTLVPVGCVTTCPVTMAFTAPFTSAETGTLTVATGLIALTPVGGSFGALTQSTFTIDGLSPVFRLPSTSLTTARPALTPDTGMSFSYSPFTIVGLLSVTQANLALGQDSGTITIKFRAPYALVSGDLIVVTFPATPATYVIDPTVVSNQPIATIAGISSTSYLSTASAGARSITFYVGGAVSQYAQVSFSITAYGLVTNPTTAGATGAFSIFVDGTTDDTFSSVPGLTILAGVVPSDPYVGHIGDNLIVSFVPTADLNIGATIKITFPYDFTIGTVGLAGTSTNFDMTSTITKSYYIITVTIAGSASLSASGVIRFGITGISNPSSPVTTGTFKIVTSAGTSPGTCAGFTIAGALSVIPQYLYSGVAGTPIAVRFIPSVTLTSGDTISITFPTAFTLDASLLSVTSGAAASSTWGLSTLSKISTRVIQLSVVGTMYANSQVLVYINGVINPSGALITPTFVITPSSGRAFATVPSVTITGALSVVATPSTVGQSAAITISFVPTKTLLTADTIVITFPVGFVIPTSIVLSATTNLVASAVGVALTRKVTITIGGTSTVAGTLCQFTLSNGAGSLRNPLISGVTPVFAIAITNAGGTHTYPAVTGPTITGILSVTPTVAYVGQPTSVTIKFVPKAILNPGDTISITFPSQFVLALSPITIDTSYSVNLHTSSTVDVPDTAGSIVIITVATAATATTQVVLRLDGLALGGSATTTSTFVIATTVAGLPSDSLATIAAITVNAGLISVVTTPAGYPMALGSAVTTGVTVTAYGVIVVAPAGGIVQPDLTSITFNGVVATLTAFAWTKATGKCVFTLTVPAGPTHLGTGDVVINSAILGATTKSDAWTYSSGCCWRHPHSPPFPICSIAFDDASCPDTIADFTPY